MQAMQLVKSIHAHQKNFLALLLELQLSALKFHEHFHFVALHSTAQGGQFGEVTSEQQCWLLYNGLREVAATLRDINKCP